MLPTVTLALMAAFMTRMQTPKTSYASFSGLVMDMGASRETFVRSGKPQKESDIATSRSGTLADVMSLLGNRLTPVEMEGILAQIHQSGMARAQEILKARRARQEKARQRRRNAKRKRKSAAKTPEPGKKTVPKVQRLVSMGPATFNTVQDAYERQLSRFPLKAASQSDGVVFQLAGICSWEARYIVKVSVSNETRLDFFVKDFVVLEGQKRLAGKSYFQLFIEPGRTRHGYVVFPSPRSGVKIKVALTEEGGRRRRIVQPVDFPF